MRVESKKISGIGLFILVFFVLLSSDENLKSSSPIKIKIALSKGCGSEHYEQYAKWLCSLRPNVECIDLYFISTEEAKKTIEEVDALVLTGGPDVEPARYGKAFDSSRCEIDRKRDTLEYWIIKRALKRKLPILAVCRGEQIINVYNGGTLIVDIPQDKKSSVIHSCPQPDSCFHGIRVDKHSMLYKITKTDSGIVNTNHHQAVDQLATIFRVSAISKDSIIEAYEWARPQGKQFFIAVQWHPERLDAKNPYSNPLGNRLIAEAIKYKKQNKRYSK